MEDMRYSLDVNAWHRGIKNKRDYNLREVRHRRRDGQKYADGTADEGKQSPSPKTTTVSPAFLISTLKRITSASHGLSVGTRNASTQYNAQIQTERKVLNRNLRRESCSLPGVDGRKLRRVAFCLDVEYTDASLPTELMKVRKPKKRAAHAEPTDESRHHKPPSGDSSKTTAQETPANHLQLSQRSEVREESTRPAMEGPASDAGDDGCVEAAKAANGAQDLVHASIAAGHKSVAAKGADGRKRRSERPECVKIYRLCCKLREAPPRKDISSKLTLAGGRYLSSINLTGIQLSVSEANCLSDFLAIVPIRNLIIDDTNLTDEGLRVVLASLLSVQTPQDVETCNETQKYSQPPLEYNYRGRVEKLSLKNNRQITEEGWRFLGCFIHMSGTLRSLDVSGVTFPTHDSGGDAITEIFVASITQRLHRSGLDYLNLNSCSVPAESLEKILRAAISTIKAIGVAGNLIDGEKVVPAIGLWLRSGGLAIDLSDLPGMTDHMSTTILPSISHGGSLVALSLRKSNLSPTLFSQTLSELSKLRDLRVLDLGNNDLGSNKSHFVALLLQYLPTFPYLKKLHLDDLSLDFQHMIILCEVVISCQQLSYIDIKNNNMPADTADAAALYNSLISAVKLAPTMVSVDLELPGSESGTFLKAKALQLIRVCLRNIERGAITEFKYDVFDESQEPSHYSSYVEEATAELNRNGLIISQDCESDEIYDDHFADIDGTGVAKALDVCLESAKGENMDIKLVYRNLLGRAEAVREKLRPALHRITNTTAQSDIHYQKRLEFILHTIEQHIEHFKTQFPDKAFPTDDGFPDDNKHRCPGDSDDDEEDSAATSDRLALVSRGLAQEEGQLHRLGHFIAEGFKLINDEESPDEPNREIEKLKTETEELDGSSIRNSILKEGPQILIQMTRTGSSDIIKP